MINTGDFIDNFNHSV